MSITYDSEKVKQDAELVVQKQLAALKNAQVTIVNPTQIDAVTCFLTTCYIAGFEDGITTGYAVCKKDQKAVVARIKDKLESLKETLEA